MKIHQLIFFGASLVASGFTGALAATDYKVSPGDVVQFQVCDEPETLCVQRVSGSGEVALPFIGTTKIAGLSLRQIEDNLRKKYKDEGYYIKPQVLLSVQTYAAKNASVFGQVERPSQVDFPAEAQEISLVEAITLAGGFTRIARLDQIRVTRHVDNREVVMLVDLQPPSGGAASNGSADFMIKPGDVVFVPERTF